MRPTGITLDTSYRWLLTTGRPPLGSRSVDPASKTD
jgi:hypothetical protein